MKLVKFYADRNENIYESFEGVNEVGYRKTFSFKSGESSLQLSNEEYDMLSTNERFQQLLELEIIGVKETEKASEKTPTKSSVNTTTVRSFQTKKPLGEK